MIRSVIIDDESNVRESIKNILQRLCPQVQVIGTADSVASGAELIRSGNPDLVFLDVKMPGGTGFGLLEKFAEPAFGIIFITAYDEFAMRAIKFNALDYLLKPIDSGELVAAVSKFERKQHQKDDLRYLLENLKAPAGQKKIAVHSIGDVRYLELARIMRFESDGSYTSIHLDDGQKLLASKAIKEFEEQLENEGFFRIHRSHLVNLRVVTGYKKGQQNDHLELKDGSNIEVYRRHRSKILEAMNKSLWT